MTQAVAEVFHAKKKGDSDRLAMEALSRAAGGDAASLDLLSSDAMLLRGAINEAIGRLEGAERLIHGKFYSALENDYCARRFEERGLPGLSPERVLLWAKEMLSAGQEHPLKKDLAALERSILTGETEKIAQLLKRAPMAPWVMDFSLREYEAENLMSFTAKYAPEPSDFAIIDLFLAEGLKLPDRGHYVRLEAPSLATALPGFTHKGAARVAECLERAGWEFCFADYLLLFGKAREEVASPDDPSREGILKEKVEMARWMSARGVSPLGRLPVGAEPAEWEGVLAPNQAAALRERARASLARGELGESGDFGLMEVFSMAGAPFRNESQWAVIGPWLIEAGLDLTRLMELAAESGLNSTAQFALPWAQKQQLMAICLAGEAEASRAARL